MTKLPFLAVLLALVAASNALCKVESEGSDVFCKGPFEHEAANAVRAAGPKALGCLAWEDASTNLFKVDGLSAYLGEFLAELEEAEMTRFDDAAAAVGQDEDFAGALEFQWLSAVYSLHLAFPRALPFDAACLPTAHYSDGVSIPVGVLMVVDAGRLPSATNFVSRLRGFSSTNNETESRCSYEDDGNIIDCERNEGSVFIGISYRTYLWQTPLGAVPESGWPTAIHYHGSFFAPHLFSWRARRGYPFGAYFQTETIKSLLDGGFAVLTPESHLTGFLFWNTNVPPFSLWWDIAPDHYYVKWLLEQIDGPDGVFGPLNSDRLYATGISSGGYMTSRMAVSYRGRFKALAVHSGAYATCVGPICVTPELPDDHPPTLFLHGEKDYIVPPYTMEDYAAALTKQNITNTIIYCANCTHEWIAEAVESVPTWFNTFV